MKLTGEDKQRLGKRYTASTAAYEHYLKGRYYWTRRNSEAIWKSIREFEQAIEIDSGYALAYAGLADSYNLLPFYSSVPSKEALQKSQPAAEKALAADDSLAEAHASMAYLLERSKWDWDAAQREYRRAIQLNPGYATAHHWYALCLAGLGRPEEALAEIQRARDADPLSLVINSATGRALHLARRYDQAIAQYRKTLEMDATFFAAQREIGMPHIAKGEYEAAIRELQKSLRLQPADTLTLGLLAQAYALAGRKGEALSILGQLKERSQREYVAAYDLAVAALGLGDKDQAFAWLDQACEQRSVWVSYARTEPLLDPLRSDPRFQALLRRMRLAP